MQGKDIGEKLFQSACSKYRKVLIKKGRPLLYQGEIPTMAFVIKTGIVKVFNITSGGDEKIVGYDGSNGIIPIGWFFNRVPVSMYYYDTFTDCELYRVPKEELHNIINSNKEIIRFLLDQTASRYISSTMHVHALEQSRASNKLLYVLQFLALRFGKKLSKSSYEINMRLTHQDIANLMGTTRETTSTEIGSLVKKGVLVNKDLKFIFNTDKALRMLGEDDFGQIVL
jgi:CRP/FNR family transcriptional regulator